MTDLESKIIEYLEEKGDPRKNKDIISENDIVDFYRCPYRLFLKRFYGLNKLPKSGAMLQAIEFINARRSLFYVRRPILIAQRRGGPNSQHIMRMTKEELVENLKFKSAEAFGNYYLRKWNVQIQNKIKRGEPMVWSRLGESGSLGFRLKKACEHYYNLVMRDGVPVLGTMDVQKTYSYDGYKIIGTIEQEDDKDFDEEDKFDKLEQEIPEYIDNEDEEIEKKDETFEFQGVKIKVKLPEIRYGRNAIDHPHLYSFGDTTANSIKVTLRMLGFSTIVKKYPFYIRRWGINPELIEEMKARDLKIMPSLAYRHFDFSYQSKQGDDGKRHEIIRPLEKRERIIKRNEADVIGLNKVLETMFNAIDKEEYPKDEEACPTCPFNLLDLTYGVVCRERKHGIKAMGSREMYLKRSLSVRDEPEDENNIIRFKAYLKKHIARRNIDIQKKVADMGLRLTRHYNTESAELELSAICATSQYKSQAFGFHYELKMLKTVDKYLSKMADEKKVPIRHVIDFKKNFAVSGQKEIKELLHSMKYWEEGGLFIKNYL